VSSLLEQLRAVTTVVADTGELPAIKAFKPEDATTNPSLILKAVSSPEYASLLENIVAAAKGLSRLVAKC
jgi:transaldolase